MQQILSWSRIITSMVFLVYASYSDFKTREVSNSVWILFAPMAFILTLAESLLFGLDLPVSFGLTEPLDSLAFYGFSVAIVSAFSILLFYAGAFGGADAKALMCLALALPTLPSVIEPWWTNLASPIFSITVFSNAVVLAALSVVYALLRNFIWKLSTGSKLFAGFENEAVWRKIMVLMTGYKIELAALEKKTHFYPLEDIATKETGEDERRLLVFPKDETQETIMARVLSAAREGKIQDGVWVTPGLPLLIFITVGLIIALFLGDFVWLLLQFILMPR